MKHPEDWLALGCESCGRSFTPDDAIAQNATCPDCQLPLRPIISILQEAASEWPEMRARIVRNAEFRTNEWTQ